MIDSEALLPTNLFADERSAVIARQRVERAFAGVEAAASSAQLDAVLHGLQSAADCPLARHDAVLQGMVATISKRRQEISAGARR